MTATAQVTPLKGISVPPDIQDKIKRAREAMRKDADKRRVMVKFWQGEQYWYVKQKGGLGLLSTALDAVDKQNFRVRNTYNFLHSIVEGKVSAATQRVPGYEIDPSSTDPEDIAGARIAQQAAFYGFDKWRMRRHRTKWVTNALVQREGFLMPYFDPNVGPFKPNEQGEYEGLGELKFLNLSRSEVGWEPGVDFDESPYYIIERAYLKDVIERLPGFVGGTIPLNAKTSDLPTDKKTSDQMAVVTMYLERPCPKYPEGRRVFVSSERVIVDARKVDPFAEHWWEPYPNIDANGEVSDEPVIHRLSYTVDPEGDDRGLVEHLIDLQRTIMDCWNKLLEIKNRALLPQMTAPKGAYMPPRDDTPGATWTYNPIAGNLKPEWERAIDPGYINQLIQLMNEAKSDLRVLAADFDVPQNLTDVAAKSLNAAIEHANARWQSFLADFAEADSRLMRHCLTIVAREYDQQRIIDIRGQYGWEPPLSFTGQDMRSQVNVRVLPGSIETKTRQSVLEEIQFIQTNWPGALQPEVAMAALHGRNAEGLFKSYDMHVARAWSLVQAIRANPAAVMNMQPRFDPEFGDPAMGFMVPGWMPRKQDNLVIWKQVIADYMINPDFDAQSVEVQHMFDLIWNGLETLEQRRMMMLAAQEQDAAAQLGQANAAKPQGPIPGPELNGLSREQAAPTAGTPASQ